MGDNKHTIILLQTGPSRSTRTYMDFETVPDAMDAVCGLFEKLLKELNPNLKVINYEVADLFGYLDKLEDISALVFEDGKGYIPYPREWIKQGVYRHLKQQASGKAR